jgi:alkylation response protein AidB-like acyl-CoA dehydrogenase
MVTFAFERGTAFVSDLVEAMRLIKDLAALSRRVRRGSGVAWDDLGLRREIGQCAAELDALWALTKRNVSQASRQGVPGSRGSAPAVPALPTVPGPGGSVLKLHYTEVRQRIGDLSLRILGRAGLALDDVGELPTGLHVEERLRAIGLGMGGGTSQIQRNIIAERILGLPRE